MFHINPQKLRKIMRFSTWKYVVEKKFAIGQTLYESNIRPNNSCVPISCIQSTPQLVLTFLKSCTINATLFDFIRPISIKNID
jgi:hypothetical protein